MSADFESCLVLARMVGRLAVSMLFYVCNRQSIFLRSRLVRRFVMLMLFLLSAEIRAFAACVWFSLSVVRQIAAQRLALFAVKSALLRPLLAFTVRNEKCAEKRRHVFRQINLDMALYDKLYLSCELPAG